MFGLNLLRAANRESRRLHYASLLREQRVHNAFFREVITTSEDSDFVGKYRLTKSEFLSLTHLMEENSLLKSSIVGISVERKVLTALLFFGSGSHQKTIGLAMKMTQRSVSKCIHEVTNALNHPIIRDRFIHFPLTQEERNQVKAGFFQKFRIPGVIGCVDGSHIAIQRPTEHEEAFFNRKHFHSLNVQFICDSNLKILSVNPKFGGATHDSYIWRTSRANTFMQELHQAGDTCWLLGDSGYPQRPWLMTPYLNAAPGSPEERYTSCHVRTRACVERCLGVLKMRWRCISRYRTLSYHPDTCAKIVTACSVLHNLAIEKNVPLPNEAEAPEADWREEVGRGFSIEENVNNDLTRGRLARNQLIQRHFN